MKVQSDNDRYLQKLEAQKGDRIAVKQAQLQNLDSVYDAKMKELQEKGEAELDTVRIKQQEELLKSVSEGEERLKEHRGEVDKNILKLEESRANAIDYHREQGKKINQNYGEKLRELNDTVTTNIQKKNELANKAIDDTKQETKSNIRQSQKEGEKQVSALINNHEKKYKEEDTRYRDIRSQADLQFYRDMARSKAERERLMREQYEKSEGQARIVEGAHQKKVTDLETNYIKLYEQREAIFQERFKQHQQANDSYLNRLKEQFNKDLKEITESHMKKKRAIENMSEDDFYHLKLLSPTITENEKFYLIDMAVPEHEKESIVLNAFDRTMRLSLSRRFNDELTDEQGVRDTTKRSEIITKEFVVKDILDPKNISQKYENGILTYKVAKK